MRNYLMRLFIFIFCLFSSVQVFAEDIVPQSREQITLSYAPLVKRAIPAVVNIYTSKTVQVGGMSPLLNDPFFRQFFGDAFGRNLEGAQKKKVQNSLGSGVLVDPSGLVVTNFHVIKGAEDIKVVLSDRREFEAKVLGQDEKVDLAILKIDAGDMPLPVLKLADSDELEVGDLVLAIGNPFGVGQTVTSGIVSALARTYVGVSDYSFFIQTDAAINPGNSGGALIDMEGRLIGINSSIYSKSGGSNGIGFAIPANMVRSVVSALSKTGEFVRPWFGASGSGVSAELAATFGLDRPVGVVITEVYPGGPADRAGLVPGDIVLRVNEHEVADPQSLRFRIATLEIGAKAKLSVRHQGAAKELFLDVEVPKEDPPRNMVELEGRHPFAGAFIVNMSPALAEELGRDKMRAGVMVMQLRRGDVAHRLGFKPGDIIREINGEKVKRVKDVLAVLNQQQAEWHISIERDGRAITMTFRG